MSKPHVLVLSPHAAIADGLVRLLTLEGRYDVRRVASLAEAGGSWQADVLLVDVALLRNADGMVPLPAPAIVLCGTREDAEQYLRRVPTAKGWLRKDPTYPELERALTAAGAFTPALARPRAQFIAMAVFGGVLLLAALATLWLAFN